MMEVMPGITATIPYLDNAATTPVDPRVVAAMSTASGVDGDFGNPASAHAYGRAARAAVETAREQVAALIRAEAREIVFTSGATESDNLALKGVAACHPGCHLVVSTIEHPAVLDCADWLQQRGHVITQVSPDASGQISPDAIAAALRPDTRLVSVMHANNETGVVNDIPAIAALCREQDVIFHTDAAQSVGKLTLDMRRTPVDLLALTAHKTYGPKGIGALYVRRRPGLALEPQMHGGGQEHGLRSGTLPTHQIIGLGAACALAASEMNADNHRIAALRERLQEALLALGGVTVHGHEARRLPGHLSVGFSDIDGDLLLPALAGIAVSGGSACSSASRVPSHVLAAMGVNPELAHGSLRISLGRFNSAADIDAAIDQISHVIRRLRG